MSGEQGAAQGGADTNAQGAQAGQQAGQGAQQQGQAQGQQGQQNGAGQAAGGQQQGTQPAAGGQAQGQQKPGSVAAGAEPEDAREPAVTFPDDWREQMAGEDKDALAILKRYRSPAGAAKALKEMRTKLSQGAHLKDKPGEDATDEEKKAWRSAQGVPDAAEGYEKGWKAPEGFILSDADKLLLGGFAKHVHGKDWTQAQFNDAMGWYVKHLSDQQAARQDFDTDFAAQSVRELKEELGPADYKRGIQSIDALRRYEGEEGLLNEILDNARMPDGRIIGNMPGVVRMLMNFANEIDPQSRITPSVPGGSGKNIEARIAEIRAIQRDPARYKEYDNNPAMKKEYAELVAAQEKLAKRRAA